MSGRLEFPEGSFIKPSSAWWEHKFMCAMCRSTDLHVDFMPYKNQLTISCNRCGNFVTMNFALGSEVEHGG